MNKESAVSENRGKPMVSVCIQTYQQVHFIAQCLDSILNQKTTFPFEIILGEDESSDGTREICISYAKKFPDHIILFLRSRKDVIVIDGKQTGRFNFKENLKASSGKYIALCEGDDYWTDELKLQKQYDFLESHNDYAVCFHKVSILKNNIPEEDYITRVPSPTTTIADLAKGNYIHTPSVMFRNGLELPIWFDEILAGDYALHILNALRGKLFCMDENMAVYRVHDGGIWSTASDEARQIRWLSVLTTLCQHIQGTAKGQLAAQRLEWAIILFNKGYKKETIDILKSEIDQLMALRLQMRSENEKILSDANYLSEKVSGTFLVKALRNKLFNRTKSSQ